jgi:hypothetical protein
MGGEKLDTRKPTSMLMLTILARVPTWNARSCWNVSESASPRRERQANTRAHHRVSTGRRSGELLTRMGPADVAKTMGIARSTVYKLGFDA